MSQQVGDRYVAWLIGLFGVLHAGFGLWAFFAPRSFYTTIASFPPHNEHFLHDIGAFLIGIGAGLLAALVWRDARFVVLLGAAMAAGFHGLSHVLDRHLGGAASDPWLLGATALLLLVGVVLRWPARDGAPGHSVVTAR